LRYGDGEIVFHTPTYGFFAARELLPNRLSLSRVRENQSRDLASANQAIVPTEIVIEHQIKGRRLLLKQSQPGPLAHFGLEAAATQRSFNASIGKEKRLGAFLLRTRAFDAG